jgi:hypothetical protein
VTRSVDSCGVSDADAAGVGNDPDRVVGIDREIPRARTSGRFVLRASLDANARKVTL